MEEVAEDADRKPLRGSHALWRPFYFESDETQIRLITQQRRVIMNRKTMLYTQIIAFLISLIISLPALAGDTKSDLVDAAKEGDTATMEALLAKGAGVNTKDEDFGKTLIHWAVENRHYVMVKLLIAQGANVNAKDEVSGWTPLHFAALWNLEDMVKLLIAQGADVNAKSSFNITPLHVVSEGGDKDMVQLLVSNGADVSSKDEFGETALACAERCGHIEIAQFLKGAGAKE